MSDDEIERQAEDLISFFGNPAWGVVSPSAKIVAENATRGLVVATALGVLERLNATRREYEASPAAQERQAEEASHD